MKILKHLFILLFLLCFAYSEVNFSDEKIITMDTFARPYHAYAVDIDNDEDLDILSAWKDYKIVWYENTKGNFSDEIIFLSGVNDLHSYSINAKDIDNDGLTDIIVVAKTARWYKNLGNKNFDSPVNISRLCNYVAWVLFSDLDGDDDLDALTLCTSFPNDTLEWYENQNNGNSFIRKKVLSGLVYEGNSAFIFDCDNDSDSDIIASTIDGEIILFKNQDGEGDFSEPTIITSNADVTSSLYASDIDNDGDKDILSLSQNKVAWYKNNGDGSFGSQILITTDINQGSTFCLKTKDLDNDGDLDVIAGSTKGHWQEQENEKIVWFENIDGNGTFGSQNIITTAVHGISSIQSVDIDNDADYDILAASKFNGKIAWYENLLNSTSIQCNRSIGVNTFLLKQNYPNPFNPSTHIRYHLSGNSEVELTIYNVIGKKVATLVNGWQNAGWHQVRWQADGLPGGIYFVRLQAGNQSRSETKKLILLK